MPCNLMGHVADLELFRALGPGKDWRGPSISLFSDLLEPDFEFLVWLIFSFPIIEFNLNSAADLEVPGFWISV